MVEYGAKEIGYRYLESRRARKTRILVAVILMIEETRQGTCDFWKSSASVD